MNLYGIKNCNSVKKAMDFLVQKQLDFAFKDIKKIDNDILNSWVKKRNLKEFINLSGMSARKINLNKEMLQTLSDEELFKLVLLNPSLIKRPVIEINNKILIGKDYEKIE
ncbi:ArsC family transcriptional regulator [Campylobacter novaezeelandiae]|uniref:ArsC family transcriptional regulator n=1 Tax=Campylobacter novaezeelandiae TaxID=2267891 RepID=A0A4Q9JT57_9BACT|nr:ArsC/Spx/MgsR family protein [Campylobacter novaezeelandiae]TBR78107.1 ArsC family transcriptional regulator [Campylobacter novaezeelandiae]TBR78659.1 ArsC family transcriptional regulator [Campylobacter novaezeelandiae]